MYVYFVVSFNLDASIGKTTSELKLEMGESMTGSIVFAADDDDDDDYFSKPDVRRGILRNPTNNHQNFYIDKQPAHCPISSPCTGSDPPVPDKIPCGGASIFWPDWEAVNQQYYYQTLTPQPADHHTDRDFTGSEASRTELWKTAKTESGAEPRKKLTVRFSPESDDTCAAAGNRQGMRTPSEELNGRVQGHAEQVQGHSERRRLNIGRIAENKFNDGRNPNFVSDAAVSTTNPDSSKANRKWYHFSFRSSKSREKAATKVESKPATVIQPIYAEPKFVDDDVGTRCRGRREMRQHSSHNTDDGYVRTLAAQGYRQIPSSVSEPEQLGRYSTQGWSPRVSSTSSAYDVQRSPTVLHHYDDRKTARGGAAVRRSRSTVGDDRRRYQSPSLPSPQPARRSSIDLTDYTPPASVTDISIINVIPETLPTLSSDVQKAAFGWYYGLDGAVNRPSHTSTHARQTGQLSPESKRDVSDNSDAQYCTAATSGGKVVWSGQYWTTQKQLGTSMTPVEDGWNKTLMISNGETAVQNHQNSLTNSDVDSNYMLRRESFLPTIKRLHSQNWMLEKHWNITGRTLPEIRVTPATDDELQN